MWTVLYLLLTLRTSTPGSRWDPPKPSGHFIYHEVSHFKNNTFYKQRAFMRLYGSQNKQRLFLNTDQLLLWRRSTFTARYRTNFQISVDLEKLRTFITGLTSVAHAMFKYDQNKFLIDRQCTLWAWNLFCDIKVTTDCRRTKFWAQYRSWFTRRGSVPLWVKLSYVWLYHLTNRPLWWATR
jgi:hypothetical protein